MTLEELVQRYPQLYHMAELGSWRTIQEHGLRSTSALLDLFGVIRQERFKIESQWRPKGVILTHPTYGKALVRDQLPMPESKLRGCLVDMTPQEWYELINRKTFFWAEKTPLVWMLKAAPYRDREHGVITIPTRILLDHHVDRITLSAINSGSVYPSKATGTPRLRGRDTFKPLRDFTSRWVTELAVEYSVPDIADLAIRVEAWQRDRRLRVIWSWDAGS